MVDRRATPSRAAATVLATGTLSADERLLMDGLVLDSGKTFTVTADEKQALTAELLEDDPGRALDIDGTWRFSLTDEQRSQAVAHMIAKRPLDLLRMHAEGRVDLAAEEKLHAQSEVAATVEASNRPAAPRVLRLSSRRPSANRTPANRTPGY